MPRLNPARAKRILLACQGAYYGVTGLWPLVSLSTFEHVTGPKTDDWLVRVVGALALVIGLVLFLASRRRNISAEIGLLAVASATAFAISDVVSVLTAGISRIYLADAALQSAFVIAWLILWGKSPREIPV